MQHKTMDYALVHVKVENFKSIQQASVDIEDGFTVYANSTFPITQSKLIYMYIYAVYILQIVTGANGSGIDCIMINDNVDVIKTINIMCVGKSCFLESIAFGLGASLSNIRAEKGADVGSVDIEKERRTQVLLTFRRKNTTAEIIIGSVIASGTREYLVDKSKIAKHKFNRILKEELGISESAMWFIGQQQCQKIVSSVDSFFQYFFTWSS